MAEADNTASATPTRPEGRPDCPEYSTRRFALVMPDDTMQMTIPRGNRLVIDPEMHLEDNGAYLFDAPFGPAVRRVRLGVSGWMLEEEDGRNRPAQHMPDSWRPLGRVVISGRMNP